MRLHDIELGGNSIADLVCPQLRWNLGVICSNKISAEQSRSNQDRCVRQKKQTAAHKIAKPPEAGL